MKQKIRLFVEGKDEGIHTILRTEIGAHPDNSMKIHQSLMSSMKQKILKQHTSVMVNGFKQIFLQTSAILIIEKK